MVLATTRIRREGEDKESIGNIRAYGNFSALYASRWLCPGKK
jgi:hypothetical protein